MPHHRPDHSAHTAHHAGAFDSDRIADALTLEGTLAAGVTDQAIAQCAELFDAGDAEVCRILDLGCGPGVATVALAAAFPSAAVVAVDGSRAMLARAEARASRHGASARVETRELDLDGDLGALGTFDLAWAGMAIHHAADEVAALRSVRALLRPHGLVCLLERADPIVVRLADDLGRPGIWDRVRAAQSDWFERARPTLPGALNADRYPGILNAAGFDVVVSQTLADTMTAPDDAATRTFLTNQLQRATRNLADFLAAADLTALQACVEPASPPHAGDRWAGATVTTSRKLFIARQQDDHRTTMTVRQHGTV
ncbi:class I SAM-dependent methyltransferase [Conexibacter sp. CPCC 206217]|uniref:class I SAM-dependent methyltransferase n=1 Tax=Conexibacter sp. CPCC 206217 TaxID=3064574 RepID=UPI002725F5BD|nr:class I SAM-dependent methyltransferase [Conexibacter sp. CPCC 206217]MDO8209722.1 class I SAM-dependent methyltransferase [Conexibacter sp. CPCC 206217]